MAPATTKRRFTGQSQTIQEEKRGNRCLTLDAADRRCDGGEVLFQVNASAGRPVVATSYGGKPYTLSDRGCRSNFEKPCDYSLQVLAILELLLNANKAAKGHHRHAKGPSCAMSRAAKSAIRPCNILVMRPL